MRMQNPRMTPADLKYNVERANIDSHFFERSAMKFFGDTMRNYGVRAQTVLVTTYGQDEPILCWELYRRRPVKHGLQSSAFFDVATFRRVLPRND